MMFVTYEQAAMHLRIDSEGDRPDVELKIEAASEAIALFLSHERDSPFVQMIDSNGDTVLVLDSNDEPIVKRTVQQATLLLLGEFYLFREGDQQGSIGTGAGTTGLFGMLPRPVVALLYPSHTPVFA